MTRIAKTLCLTLAMLLLAGGLAACETGAATLGGTCGRRPTGRSR